MPRKPYVYHYVYKTTCSITNRYYIGVHSTNVLEDGYLGSGIILRRSIYKYGKENHVKEILKYTITREEAEEFEENLIDLVIFESNCMNLTNGGKGFKMKHSPETKHKISTALSNKTYIEIYGTKRSEIEKNKRRISVKKNWENLCSIKKTERATKISGTLIKYFENHKSSFKELTCPYCGSFGKSIIMYRWHFENCKKKI